MQIKVPWEEGGETGGHGKPPTWEDASEKKCVGGGGERLDRWGVRGGIFLKWRELGERGWEEFGSDNGNGIK